MGTHIELEDAGVSLGGQTILRGLTLSVGTAEVLGIAGPNGSGKTTLLRLLATLSAPDQGTGRVLGAALGTPEVHGIRREIGLIGHIPTVVAELTLRENLEHATRLFGGDTSRIERALQVVGLAEAADRKVEQSSYGMLRRTEAARLLITKPRVLLLDEAFSGLDVHAQDLIDALISRTTDSGGAVVMVSHDAAHLAERSGRVLALAAGPSGAGGMTFWDQAVEIARVDLRIERRMGDVLRIILPFAVIAVLVIPLALGVNLAAISQLGPAVFWAIGVLFGMQVALRQAADDRPERRDLYSLLGVDPAARFVGRSLSGSMLTASFMVALLIATFVLYSPRLPSGWPGPVILALLLTAVGLTELGTLAGEVTSGLRSRTALASLIIAPLAIPLVIGASQTLESLTRDTSILPWLLLLVATDLALAVAGVALARPLEEASR